MEKTELPLTWSPYFAQPKWYDLFVYPINSCDDLLPDSRAEIIVWIWHQLCAVRPSPLLWIQVALPETTRNGRGQWYINELMTYLEQYKDRIFVRLVGETVQDSDFAGNPAYHHGQPVTPDFLVEAFRETLIGRAEIKALRILRFLAHVAKASTHECASMAGLTLPDACHVLAALEERAVVKHHLDSQDVDGLRTAQWGITPAGVEHVRQSWNIPAGMGFRKLLLEQKYVARRRQWASRLCPARLAESWGQHFQPWQAWSEQCSHNLYPDSLVWGQYDGVETLVWTEVESGVKPIDRIRKDIASRYHQAKTLAATHHIRLIYVILAPSAVIKCLDVDKFDIPANVAVVSGDWRRLHPLPSPFFWD